MSERTWRLILGLTILFILSFDLDLLMFGLIGWLYFEVITNIRVTKIVSRLRYGQNYIGEMEKNLPCVKSSRLIGYEAERMLRFTMATFLVATFHLYPIWFFPWLVGLMLTSAGLTNICPMLYILQWLGFKPVYH